MKKIYILLTCFLLSMISLKAQDTLLFQDFELNQFYNVTLMNGSPPLGITVDTNWYSWDSDGVPDGSTGGGRPDGWFSTLPFSKVDQYLTQYSMPGALDTNTVLAANSWTNTTTQEQNWLITSNIHLGLHDTLFWKSAPYQTPRYMDGYEVRLSTTTNLDNTTYSFINLLFTAAEMAGTPATDPDTVYADFTFAPTTPGTFVHGLDGTHIDPAGLTAPVSHRGRLRPFSAPLDAFADQNVFITFLHNSTDDNLLSLDDIMIRGTPSTFGINENKNDMGLNVFPNPASDQVQVNYNLVSETTVIISVSDVTGKLIISETKGAQPQGRHFAHINTADLASGFYTVSVQTNSGRSTTKLIVR